MSSTGKISISIHTDEVGAIITMPDDVGLEAFLKHLTTVAQLAGYDYVRGLEPADVD